MSAARCRSFCAPVETSPKVSASAGNAAAEALELLRALEELNDLLEFLLGLVHAGHVVEGDADLALGIDLRPVPPEPAQRQHALARAQLLEHEPPDEPHDADGQDPDEEQIPNLEQHQGHEADHHRDEMESVFLAHGTSPHQAIISSGGDSARWVSQRFTSLFTVSRFDLFRDLANCLAVIIRFAPRIGNEDNPRFAT
jgi:hypothetical protein